MRDSILGLTASLFLTLAVATVSADPAGTDPGLTKTAYAPAPGLQLGKESPGLAAGGVTPRDYWVFSAPPRGNIQEERATYEPIVQYLSKATGKKIIYQPADNWLSYAKDMTAGEFDLVFDGPHFNGWRQDRIKHTPLVKLPEDFVFVVVTRKDDPVKDIKNLVGRKVCAHAPPNLGTLTLLSKFDNPARQPHIVTVKGWKASYDGLVAGQCVATVLPLKNLQKFDGGKNLARVLYQHRALPNQAFSAGPRIPESMRAKIAQALLSEDGKRATAKLRATYAAKDLIPATSREYAGLGVLLRDELYYQY